MRVARGYLRVSTQGQGLDRQESIIAEAREAGYYIAGVYREKASDARRVRFVGTYGNAKGRAGNAQQNGCYFSQPPLKPARRRPAAT